MPHKQKKLYCVLIITNSKIFFQIKLTEYIIITYKFLQSKKLLRIINYNKVSSTNDIAKSLVDSSSNVNDFLVLAKSQTAGRGRLCTRNWLSPEGNFCGTYVFNLNLLSFSSAHHSLFNSLSLYSILDTLSALVFSTVEFKIKLPNDILLNNKKLAGVLVEIILPFAFIGIGINLLISPLCSSTSLFEAFDLKLSPTALALPLYLALVTKIKQHAKIFF